MRISRTVTRTHVLVGYANPFLVCAECRKKVPYWHDPDRCGCNGEWYLHPCEHKADIISTCPSWNPVEGCICTEPETHDKE